MILVVVAKQEFFGMVERIDTGLPEIQVRWWDPFGVGVLVFAGSPALFGHFVVGAAGLGEVVDVGDGVGGVGVAVVGFAEVGGHGAARERAAAVFGEIEWALPEQCHDSMRG